MGDYLKKIKGEETLPTPGEAWQMVMEQIRKYGKENFEKFFIQYCETRKELDNQEIFWITEYRKRGKAE